ncbi:MAG: DUF4276 family protein [Phycisphaeraceae bacterium]|nr:DUF4276 family protein [Phycisphaeraceae bacterium]
MNELVFLLEESSAEAMLRGVLPRLCSDNIAIRYIVFEGKQDLEKQMVRRLQGYRNPEARFVVLRDKDSADCRTVKNELVRKCTQARKPKTLVRIACHELESWYLADLAAVERALNIRNLAAKQNKAKYRTPDSLANAAEELEILTGKRYQKIAGSRAIGPYLNVTNTRSHSFSVFISGLQKLIGKN